MRLEIKVDTRGYDAAFDRLVRAVATASTRTANRLIEQAKTAGLREISKIYGLGPRTFEKYVQITLARDGENEATIRVRGRELPVYLFDPRQTKAGVTVRIKGRRILIPGAFLARMRSGHIGVFARGAYGGKGLNGRTSGRKFGRFVFLQGGRLPINEFYTFGPAEAFSNEDVVDTMQDRVFEQIDDVMRRELRFALRSA